MGKSQVSFSAAPQHPCSPESQEKQKECQDMPQNLGNLESYTSI